jgi:hypothetical protein
MIVHPPITIPTLPASRKMVSQWGQRFGPNQFSSREEADAWADSVAQQSPFRNRPGVDVWSHKAELWDYLTIPEREAWVTRLHAVHAVIEKCGIEPNNISIRGRSLTAYVSWGLFSFSLDLMSGTMQSTSFAHWQANTFQLFRYQVEAAGNVLAELCAQGLLEPIAMDENSHLTLYVDTTL